MVPDKFNMVDMDGIDLIMMQGEEVPGLYIRLVESITQCRYQCLYNWFFDGIVIPPTYVKMEVNEDDEVEINEGVSVSADDVLHIYSLEIPVFLPLQEKTCTPSASQQNIIPDEEYYGLSNVVVYGSQNLIADNIKKDIDIFGVIGSYEAVYEAPNYNILCNWDFSNIVNTRGQNSYSSGYGFDGWSIYHGVVTRDNGGITIAKAPQYSFALSGQFITQGQAVQAMFGKEVTISALVDDVFDSFTFTPSSTGPQDQGRLQVNGYEFYYYRDSATSMPFYIATRSSSSDKVIRAVKSEFGSQQTLCHLENGVWVLNSHQETNAEYFRVRLSVNNS